MSKIEDLLPDFDDMNSLANIVARKKIDADQCKLQLDTKIAECVRKAYTDHQYWINGKPPTQSFIDSVVKVVGNSVEDSEIISTLYAAYRTTLREAEESANLLENMRNQVQAFQTISANRRQGLL